MSDRTIPAFEGHPVAQTSVKMSGNVKLDDIQDEILHMDDLVQCITQFRCVGVYHQTDDKTGEITRVQVLRPIEVVLAPFDDSDPNDVGILRAIPHGSVVTTRQLPAGQDQGASDE